jgi:hypothetical protein
MSSGVPRPVPVLAGKRAVLLAEKVGGKRYGFYG